MVPFQITSQMVPLLFGLQDIGVHVFQKQFEISVRRTTEQFLPQSSSV